MQFFANVLSYILFRVIRAHGRPIVDILFKDIANYIRIDVLARCGNARVQVPVIVVKEFEDAFKGFIFNRNRFIFMLDLVDVE